MQNNVQDVGVSGVSRPGKSADSNAYRERYLDPRAVLFHHAHTQNGKRTSARCPFCSKGLSGITKELEIPKREQPHIVVEDSGGDEERAAAPASDSGEYWQ